MNPQAIDDFYEPSTPNRIWFALKLSIVSALGVSWFRSLDSELWPLYVFPALAGVVGLRNLHSLLSPPYLRLSPQGMQLRVWPHHSKNGMTNWSAVFAILFYPFRKYVKIDIPWSQLTSFNSCRNNLLDHFLDVCYQDSDGTAHQIAIPRECFSIAPSDLGIAIQAYYDCEFQWKPLRDSGALNEWAICQRERYQHPFVIRYRADQGNIVVGALGVLLLSMAGSLVALEYLSPDGYFTTFLIGLGLLGIGIGISELRGRLTIRTVVLSDYGVSLGGLDTSATRYPWADVISARVRQRVLTSTPDKVAIVGLDVYFANGKHWFLPAKYDLPLVELEQLLIPSDLKIVPEQEQVK